MQRANARDLDEVSSGLARMTWSVFEECHLSADNDREYYSVATYKKARSAKIYELHRLYLMFCPLNTSKMNIATKVNTPFILPTYRLSLARAQILWALRAVNSTVKIRRIVLLTHALQTQVPFKDSGWA